MGISYCFWVGHVNPNWYVYEPSSMEVDEIDLSSIEIGQDEVIV